MTNEERLRRIEAITDAALSGLNIAGLLERVRDLLKVDTATILLLDDHTGELVTTAAKGPLKNALHGEHRRTTPPARAADSGAAWTTPAGCRPGRP
ncbi:hypothetical protein AB0B94_07685 [Micromonospora sp. NPDC048986]|uniref:hypothetical protein n=1 Tax=Micromonospora sp. NPDC048986 TaxID=3155644 RepID=UPI003404DD4F